jgi:hypothetical protein
MSEGSGHRQHARLFLEGREVPFVSASITAQINQPCTAYIDLVPLQKIKFIRPKTQVHIFVRDDNTFGDAGYYLAFEGEVVGRGYVKRVDSRSVQITAMDYTSYLDDAKAFFMNALFAASRPASTVTNGAPPPGTNAKAAAGKVIPTDSTSGSYFIQVLTSKKDKSGKIDLIAGIVEVIKRLALVNEFYRAAYERLRISDRFRAYAYSKLGSVLSGIRSDIFFQSFAGANGGMESIYSLLSNILGLLFHEMNSLPFPGKGLNEKGPASLSQYHIVPDSYTLPPPKCNVLFPSQIIGFNFNDDFRAQPTRYLFRGSYVMPAKDKEGGANTMMYPTQAYPTSFSDYMFRKKTVDTTEGQSLLGPSAIIKSADGRSYANVMYGDKKKDKAVGGTAIHPVLRDADFLTNEESIRGIVLAEDTYAPNFTALKRGSTPDSRNSFFQVLGQYMFFKKRFGARQCSADVLFNPNIALGYNALFLDDGDIGQSFVAKVQSITHVITNSGFSTQLGIAYGRDFDEVDMLTGKLGDPPLPPWLDSSVFGKEDSADFTQETEFLKSRGLLTDEERDFRERLLKTEVGKNGKPTRGPQKPYSYKNLSKYYNYMLGSEAITGFKESVNSTTGKKTLIALATTRGAVNYIVSQYKNSSNRPGGREAFVRNYTKRLFISMEEAFSYLGASTNSYGERGELIIPQEFAFFSSDQKVTGNLKGRFDGTGFSDENILLVRREIIDAYVKLLRERRNFRG